MQGGTSIRRTVRGIRRRLATAYTRCFFPTTATNLQAFRSELARKRGLELGGPSGILGDQGPLPVYDVLESLDNCLYSSRTIWTGEVGGGASFIYHPKKKPGTQFLCDATQLELRLRDCLALHGACGQPSPGPGGMQARADAAGCFVAGSTA